MPKRADGDSVASVWARQAAITGHPAQVCLASRVDPPGCGNQVVSSGPVWAHSASRVHSGCRGNASNGEVMMSPDKRKPATMGGLVGCGGGGCASQRQREEPLNGRGRLPLPGINAPHQCIALRADHSPDPARCVAMVNPQRGGWPGRSMNSGLGAAYLTLPVSPGKEPLERLATEAMDS